MGISPIGATVSGRKDPLEGTGSGGMARRHKASEQHARTRSDHATELAEDYVEAIDDFVRANGQCRVTDLAEHFGVSHVTVNRTVGRLQKGGWVTTEPYGPIELTDEGSRLAEVSRKRHEVVLQFLMSLGVSESVANIDAEGIEHHVSDETLEAMQRFIGEQVGDR